MVLLAARQKYLREFSVAQQSISLIKSGHLANISKIKNFIVKGYFSNLNIKRNKT